MNSLKTFEKQIAALKKKVIFLKGESVFATEEKDTLMMQAITLQKGTKHEN